MGEYIPRELRKVKEKFWTTNDVMGVTGCTLRQVQVWDETNLITPVQIAARRVYFRDQVVEMALVTWLRNLGIKTAYSRKALIVFRKWMKANQLGEDSGYLLITWPIPWCRGMWRAKMLATRAEVIEYMKTTKGGTNCLQIGSIAMAIDRGCIDI